MKFGYRMKNCSVDWNRPLFWMISFLIVVKPQEVLGDCKNVIFLLANQGRYLRHHSIENLTDATQDLCQITCYLHHSCMSYNYCTRSATCEINDADQYSHPVDLVRKAGSVYVGTDNACTSSPCLGNATCQPNFYTQRYSCLCQPGFSGPYCTDIDECASDSSNCSANHTCINTAGSYECICKPGYQAHGITCIDIDECTSDSSNCSSNHTCINTAGSYECICKPGYQAHGITCIDMDECASGFNNCSANHTCINTAGSYDCFCKPGFEEQGASCIDIDECATEASNNCSGDSKCVNTEASFECRCDDGYEMFENKCTKIVADYIITVYTADVWGAGTDANVFIMLHGSHFKKTTSSRKQLSGGFERGRVDTTTINGELPNMELLSEITMSHDNKGLAAGWYFNKVVVDNKTRKMKYTFTCDCRLGWSGSPLSVKLAPTKVEGY